MEELQIPDQYRPGFKQLVSLDTRTVEKIIDALKQAKPSSIDNLVSVVSSQVDNLTVEEIKDVIETVISLYNLRQYLQQNNDVSTEELIEKISQAIQDDEEIHITDEQKQQFEQKLALFLESDTALNFTSKVAEALRDHERIFTSSSIHTDMRPVFESNLETELSGVVILHMLKIEYADLDGKHEFFLALNSLNLEQLREQIDIASRRTKSIESMLNKASISYLNNLDLE
ncbi:MAG TPA: hypothetical protein VK184_22010 [Nostocaceae cyanobacterium]|nr:hypothetical protein [Nostocaceae cyanobacterium]